jgi:hypothetical protein
MAQAVGGCALERQPALTHALLVEIAYGVVRKGTYHPGAELLVDLQGDFHTMQGDAKRTLAKSLQISMAWMVFSLLQVAGRSREGPILLAGFANRTSRSAMHRCSASLAGDPSGGGIA